MFFNSVKCDFVTHQSCVLSCLFNCCLFHLHEDWSGASMLSLPSTHRQFIMVLSLTADPKAIP